MLDRPSPSSTERLDRFAAIVGDAHAFRTDTDRAAFDEEQRGAFPGRAALVLRPSSVDDVSAILSLASETRTSIVPQGGNTGLVGAGVARGNRSTPGTDGATGAGLDVVVSLQRLNRIRDVDAPGNTLTVESGCVLARVQEAADEVDQLFPLSLGSEGTAQIGGLISSNAGGTGVLAYGNTRDLVMGIEAVLPSGEVWNGLSRLRKNNTGYDLKHLFIGGEGTLGIVTAATLKLFPKPKGREVAFVGLHSPDHALRLFGTLRAAAGSQLTGFELIARTPLAMTIEHFDHREPLDATYPWYALVEVSSGRSAEDAREVLEAGLADALEREEIVDAVLAGSLSQAREFWHIREDCSHAQRREGGSIKHDISVPVHAIPEFIRRAEPVVHQVVPNARVVCFGHMGDGNLHYNVSQPVGADREAFLGHYEAMNDAVFALAIELDGSISAEHGIGQQKRERLRRIKSPVEITMMERIKHALDPLEIMNPGKLL